MIDLYYSPGTAAMAPHAVLEEVGAPHRLVLVDSEGDRAELAKLNPHRRLPTLVDGDLVLYESVACVMHLSDAYPDAGLAPALRTAERALWYRWLTYLTNTVQATFMHSFYPGRATADPAGAPAVKARADEALAGMRGVVERELAEGGPYVLGETFSSADLYLLMLTRWGRRLEPKWWDGAVLGAHFRRVYERDAVQRMWLAEGLDPAF